MRVVLNVYEVQEVEPDRAFIVYAPGLDSLGVLREPSIPGLGNRKGDLELFERRVTAVGDGYWKVTLRYRLAEPHDFQI